MTTFRVAKAVRDALDEWIKTQEPDEENLLRDPGRTGRTGRRRNQRRDAGKGEGGDQPGSYDD